MKKGYKKEDFPVSGIRKFLEPGPIVLVSSRWNDTSNIMTMGWHSVMEFSPSLIGCVISTINHTHKMVKSSKECVINIPTSDLIETIVGIGTTTGSSINKFEQFELTAEDGDVVKAPLIKECYANFECRVVDTSLVNKYNYFILEVVKAHVAISPKYPKTVHYRGEGIFMLSGEHVSYARKLKHDKSY